MSRIIETQRLRLRPWEPADTEAALAVYAAPAVCRWVDGPNAAAASVETMSAQLARWSSEDQTAPGCLGHWALAHRSTSGVVGALALDPALGGDSVAISWALAPQAWGQGYAAEAGDALARWAIHEQGALEVFALVQPDNARAQATAERIGMDWVTDLGHLADGGRYRVYRIRHADLDLEDNEDVEVAR